MNAKVQVLESLLARVQANALASRGAKVAHFPLVPAVEVSAPKGAAALELDEPGAALGHSAPPDSFGVSTLPPPIAPSAMPIAPPVSLDSEPPPADFGLPQPTIEQLGQTVSLEEGPEVKLEVERAVARGAESPAPPSTRGLEAAIPSRPSATAFDLPAPPEAREELERYRLGQTAEVKVDAYARPSISTNVVELVTAQREFQPVTFAQLLEASLKL